MKADTINCCSPPIFILSCVRSGSTLLRYIIDTHPDICSPGELHLGRLSNNLIKLVDSLSLGQVAMSSSRDERTRLIYDEVNSIISEWMNFYAKSRGKRFWCEKSPTNVHYLHILEQVFTDAKYICLYRNCMDVVHSMSEMAKKMPVTCNVYYRRNENEVCAYVDSWIDNTSKLLAFEQENASRCIRVRYEDLVSDPVRTLNPVFDLIGVAWNKNMLDSVFSAQRANESGDYKIKFSKEIHKNSIGNGATISTQHITDSLLQEMNNIHEKLDYPLVGQDWGQSPSLYIKTFVQERDNKNSRAIVDINEIFEKVFPQRLKANPQWLQETKGVCKFVVTGHDKHTWMIDLNIYGGEIRVADEEADCTITITRNDLIDIVNGELNPAQAFFHEKVRLAGNINLAIDLGQILFGPTFDRV
jgi:hypothetical protein